MFRIELEKFVELKDSSWPKILIVVKQITISRGFSACVINTTAAIRF